MATAQKKATTELGNLVRKAQVQPGGLTHGQEAAIPILATTAEHGGKDGQVVRQERGQGGQSKAVTVQLRQARAAKELGQLDDATLLARQTGRLRRQQAVQ